MGAARELRRENLQLKQMVRELERLALTDSLTGVSNRRHFDDAIGPELQRAVRGRYVVALALVDVDWFKSINDRYGHSAGDEVLREIARRLRSAARQGDCVYRYGGEEFAVVLAPAGQPLDSCCERLLAAVSSRPLAPVGAVTCSVGLAVFDGSALRADEIATAEQLRELIGNLIGRADAALYRAKREGRARACVQ